MDLLICFAIVLQLFSYETDASPSHHLENEVCYENLGCFYRYGGLLPFIHLLPRPPAVVKNRYFIHSTALEKPMEVDATHPEHIRPYYVPDWPTIIFNHGFTDDGGLQTRWINKELVPTIKMAHPMTNIIILDWRIATDGGGSLNYIQSLADTELAAREESNLIVFLMNEMGLDIELDLHVLGHSLGTQLSGMLGFEIQRRTGKKIARITAIDPASPMLYHSGQGPDSHLGPEDAHVVSVIHTNGGLFYEENFGVSHPIGTIDFYPNGGKKQPGCPNHSDDPIDDGSIPDYDHEVEKMCDHLLGRQYFVQSMFGNCSFKAVTCPGVEKLDTFERDFIRGQAGCSINCLPDGSNCGVFGYDLEDTLPGIYYFLTAPRIMGGPTFGNQMYCGHMYKLSLHLHLPTDGVVGQINATLSDASGSTDLFAVTDSNEFLSHDTWVHRVMLHPGVALEGPDESKHLLVEFWPEADVLPPPPLIIQEARLEDGEQTFYGCSPLTLEAGQPGGFTLQPDPCTT